MEVLGSGQPRPLRRRIVPIAILVTLTVSACLLAPPAEVRVAFSHAVHVGEKNLACDLCHPGTGTREAAGLAPVEMCARCHDELDQELPAARRLRSAHYDDYKFRRTPVATLPADVVFSHRAHAHAADLDCATCHGSIATSDGIPRPSISKADCMGCHARRDVSNECDTCHRTVDRTWLPASHDAHWVQAHGAVAQGHATASADRCELCHDQRVSCDTCHRETPPADHTQHFRLRGHGTLASIDRSRCATCHHRRDFCQRCHESTPPLDHLAGWGGTSNRHCSSCHFPPSTSGCATCHQGGAPHPTATPMPAWHTPVMNCRLCHVGAMLPHPDPGHPCAACHR